ncbi:MAG: phosphoribosylamine--glycine ligase [Candidatus Omnitrophota bacterium]
MRILVVGSGGREHALVWKIAQSKRVNKIFCAPGNGGINELAKNIDIKADDIEGLLKFVKKENIDLTVVGPEIPLALGITDVFRAQGLNIFGPTKAASQLESSKIFAKNIMKRYGVPTADFQVFSVPEEALEYVRDANRPLVIKANGLCAGKGVYVCTNLAEQEKAIKEILEECVFGASGRTLMIEEMLTGEEASIIVISDGENILRLASSQDHKRIFDKDQGPNTGGMGAYSPAPVITQEMFAKIEKEVIIPTIRGMKKEGIPFTGVLYAGMMITENGPKVLEFNVRFGDPETQVILPRLKTDLIEIILKAQEQKINQIETQWDERDCVCVVMASGGYPGKYEKTKQIFGLDQLKQTEDIIIFHAGTKQKAGNIFTNGGRVLGVTGLGAGMEKAMDKAYSGVEKIKFENMFFRKDIGKKALNRKTAFSG